MDEHSFVPSLTRTVAERAEPEMSMVRLKDRVDWERSAFSSRNALWLLLRSPEYTAFIKTKAGPSCSRVKAPDGEMSVVSEALD